MSQSPELSGNAGTTYETQVAAFFMSALLVNGGVLGLEGATGKSVALQRKALGDPLDDVVVVGVRKDGSEAKLQLQAKSKITVSDANEDFREIIAACWEAMGQATFQAGRDRFGAVTETIASEKRRNLRRLHDDALYSTDAADFIAKVNNRGGEAQKVYAALGASLKRAAGRDLTEDEVWKFFRHFLLVEIRTTGEGANERHMAVERLRGALSADDTQSAPDLFDALESLARKLNRTAGKVDAESLGDHLAARFTLARDVAPDSVEQLTIRAREGAQHDLSGFVASREGSFGVSMRPSFLESPDGKDDSPLSLEGYVERLAKGAGGLLIGQPGAGKSTSLLHIGGELLEAYDTTIPIIVPLPEFKANSLIEEMLRRPALRDIGQLGMERLAGAGRIIVLCDAWNEVSQINRDAIKIALAQFSRSFPKSAVVVASRSGGAYPISHDRKMAWLSPLSREQQLALLTDLVGDNAEALLAEASATEGLRDLIQTPFYLAALGKLNPTGQLPSTRDQLIAGLMAEYEQRVVGRTSFETTLRGVHVDVLRSLGSELVRAGTTWLPEPQMRAFITKCSKELIAAAQIAHPLEPGPTIQSLVDHHVLSRSQLAEVASYALPHEQIQEWLASFEVESALRAVADDGGRSAFVRTYLNDPRWAEPVFFAVERVGRAPETAGIAAKVVGWALGVDRQFAAQIVARAGDLVWAKISSLINQYIAAWKTSQNPPLGSDLAAFLTTCGRDELGSELWSVLEGDVDGQSLHDVHAQNLLKMLRAEWAGRYSRLAPSQRRALVYDLISWGPPEAVEWALAAAIDDPVFDVLDTVVNLLEYERSDQLDRHSDAISEEAWLHLAKRVSLRNLEPGPFGERLITEKLRALETETDKKVRLRLELELASGGVAIDNEELVRLALENKENWSDQVVPILREWAPAELSKAIVSRLEHGAPIGSEYFDCILANDTPPQDHLVEIGTRADTPWGVEQLAGRLLEFQTIIDLLQSMLTMQRESAWDNPKRERYHALGDLVSRTRFDQLIIAVEAIDASDAQTIEVLAERLFRWRQNREHLDAPISAIQLARVSKLVHDWCGVVLAADAHHRSVLADLAHTIQVFGLNEHLDNLAALTRKDSALWAGEEDEFLERVNSGNLQGAQRPMSYGMFANAFREIEDDRLPEVLVSLLSDRHFGPEAATLLRRFGGVKLPAKGFFGRQEFEGLAERRAQLLANADKAPHPIAQLVIDQIETLLESDEKADFDRAFAFVQALTLMDYGNRFDLIDRILRDERTGQRGRLSLLEGLKVRGATLPDDCVLAGLEAAISERLAAKWSSENDWWQVRAWIILSAFMENPQAALTQIARLPQRLRWAHNFDDLIDALGHAGTEKGCEDLALLIREQPQVIESSAWARALQRIGTSNAFDVLFDTALEALKAGRKTGDSLRHSLSQFVGTSPGLMERILDRTDWRDHPATLRFVPQILSDHLSEPLALRLFAMADGDKTDPIGTALLKRAGDLGVRRDPVEGISGAWELTPIRLDDFRKQLALEVFAGSAKADLARRILTVIDESRLHHGRPLDEPRHPHIASGCPWPPYAGFVWDFAQTLAA